ncbi:hypothetical protein MBAV_005749 [Candidatus Magnetobacterium bavaricum]|uniref:Uncharacterized protein n=1 Tax=Candidatus Magnetobacterium bavaricum TaxID=29290 RepID=A0A0F3GJF1_9BACT|nr:hypothetical protein MBAV_005749 [Candidatus Magnetobacterium bavaricum]
MAGKDIMKNMKTKEVQFKNSHLIICLVGRNVSKIKSLFYGTVSVPWLYFGEDYFKLRAVETKLGKEFERIDISHLLNDISNKVRIDFVNWIDNLNIENGKNIEWWFGTVSTRNIYVSSLFQCYCYIKVLESLWLIHKKKPSLIVVESLGLAMVIKKMALIQYEKVTFLYPLRALSKVFSKYKGFVLQWGYYISIMFIRLIAAYVSRSRVLYRRTPVHPIVIIDTFLFSDSLSDDGCFNDRYYPYLYEFIEKKGISIMVHPVLYGIGYRNYFSLYKKMRQNKVFFIVREDFLLFSDYLYTSLYPLKVILNRIKSIPLVDIDIMPVIKEDKLKDITASMEAVLIYRLFIRLGKTDLQPNFVIDWYENQVIDRALISAIRTAFPNVIIIGAQIFLHTPNTLNLYPIQSEVEASVTPHKIIIMNDAEKKNIMTYTDNIFCVTGASLRYSHLFQHKEENHNITDRRKTIMVLLPFHIGEAIELLERLYDGIKLFKHNVNILIKCHQCYTPEHIIKIFGQEKWSRHFITYIDTIKNALDRSDIVVSGNTSAIIEAAIYGIPVIYNMRQTVLNHNILTEFDIEYITEAFTSDELWKSIDIYLNISKEQRNSFKSVGMKLRERFFTPINEKSLDVFIPQNCIGI